LTQKARLDPALRDPALRSKTEALALSHEAFSRNTRVHLKEVFDALRALMRRPIRPSGPSGSSRRRTRARRVRPRGASVEAVRLCVPMRIAGPDPDLRVQAAAGTTITTNASTLSATTDPKTKDNTASTVFKVR
jgi:hypothetical protein